MTSFPDDPMAASEPDATRALSAMILPGAAGAFVPIAEIVCAPRGELVETITQDFGEMRAGRGIRAPDSVMEVWTCETTGNWTLVTSYADGRACVVASARTGRRTRCADRSGRTGGAG